MDLFGNSSTSDLFASVSLNISNETLASPNSAVRSTIFLISAGCLAFIGTVGNVLFILCFWLEKKLRSVSNYLITFLALADIFTCLGCILVYIVMVNKLSSVYSCWYWLSTFPLCPIISMYCQFLISIDRTVLVTHSVGTYKKWFNRKFTTIYVLLGWMFHVIMIVFLIIILKPPVLSGKHRCNSVKALGSTRQRIIYVLNGCSIIYCGMACICYGRLIYYVRQRRVTLTSTKQAYVKTSIILLILCVIAVTSTFLSPVLVYISFSVTNNPQIFAALDEVGTFIFFLGFAINPFVYGYRISVFRNKVKSMFMLCFMTRVGPYPLTETTLEGLSQTGARQERNTLSGAL